MTEQELKQQKAAGNVTPSQPEEIPKLEKTDSLIPDFEMYLAILETLQRPKRHLTAAPSFVPRNFAEQIQISDDGTDKKLHVYINGAWADFTAD
jgi:hypothetical protein